MKKKLKVLTVKKEAHCITAFYDGRIFIRWWDVAVGEKILNDIWAKGWIVQHIE